ncbi:hypothetical protein C3747_486g34c [Trypanosoma cruzi]|uniref:Uncharacterized protein n=2 Tax=Trypanosoma cruzi TaxID=5693 RepID=Q4D2T8_TRYCC|nr:hypothetical protein, conserved [Trypanosoma cruzi]EAN86844.1 hypothetical protein, conserved [Trypanosoma cruzi]PWU87331.1 hypothetical protein C3747_486g34c [Trypanosoma cruzi]RNC50801.1 hypothetical protein TcCL_ESM12139 [Trypanosoma cruzi]|eukprot:XP_808695.1 hypothetical protein [Trypanosoma cruzi strain CL Brener]
MNCPRTLFSLLLVFLLVMFTTVHGAAGDDDRDASDTEGDDDSSFKYLEMLEVSDLRQMLHEKKEPFHHLQSKQELIHAIITLEKKEKLVKKLRRQRDTTTNRPHVLRVEYCSG